MSKPTFWEDAIAPLWNIDGEHGDGPVLGPIDADEWVGFASEDIGGRDPDVEDLIRTVYRMAYANALVDATAALDAANPWRKK